MPQVIGLTQSQKNHHSNDATCKHIRLVLRTAMDRMTIKELGEIIHVDPRKLRRMFNGDTKWDIPTLIACLDALHVPESKRARLLTRR